ncbi:hypothetical protein ES708_05157 [subsurface metagenome]
MKKKANQVFFIAFFFFTASNAVSQVTADFSADDTLGCNPFSVQFTNEGSTGVDYTYDWYFGTASTSNDENPSFTFLNGGVYPVKLVVTNTSTSESDSITRNITVIQTPTARLDIDSSNACINGNVEFVTGAATKDSVLWDFGDGTFSSEAGSRYMYHAYAAHGSYNVRFITYYQICSDTSSYTITVDGPVADFNISTYEACKGTPITFTLGDTTDVQSFFWDVGEDNIIYFGDSAVHSYDTMGYIVPELHVSGASGNCIVDDTIHIFVIRADFTYAEDKFCDQEPVFFVNTSIGDDNSFWDFGNGNTSISQDPSQTFSAGSYTVSLKISNTFGCSDSIQQDLVIHDPPILYLSEYAAVCPGGSVEIQASGGHVILWEPGEGVDDPTSYTPVVSPEDTTTYTATITDTITNCVNSGQITIVIQGSLIPGKISVFPTDTSIIIGDTVAIVAYDSLNRDIIAYNWSPDERITCTDCPDPTVQPLQTTTYTLVVTDTNECFISESFEVNIEVTEEYRIGVPDAFTPNGDQINDEIKVDGWGIKNLIEFRIYNRWGTEVFFTNDINQAWDGKYKGKLQSIDSYAYVLKAEMWDDRIVVKKGTLSLIR